MANIIFSKTTPAAPAFRQNVQWQTDGALNPRFSASIPLIPSIEGVNTQTANYHLVAADAGYMVRMNVAAANTVTVDPDSTTNFGVGSVIFVRQTGAGVTTIVAGGGVTITGAGTSLAISRQYGVVQLIKVAANTWDAFGDFVKPGDVLPIDARTSTSEAIVDGDRGKVVTFTNAAATAATIPQAGSGSLFISGWFCWLENNGAGVVTLTPATSLIDGRVSIPIQQYSGFLLYSDGANYFTGRLFPVSGTPTGNQVLSWNATNNDFEPVDISTLPNANASKIQSVTVVGSAPLAGQSFRYDRANSRWGLTLPRRFRGWAYIPANSGSPSTTGSTVWCVYSRADIVSVAPNFAEIAATSGELPGSQLTLPSTTASRGSSTLFISNSALGHDVFKETLGICRFRLSLTQATKGRWWIGLANASLLGPAGLASDDPGSGHIIAFRFSNAASSPTDSVWKGVTKDGTTSNVVTLTGTGSTPDTSTHEFVIAYDTVAAAAYFYIDGALMGSSALHLPTSAMCPFFSVDNLASNPAITPGFNAYLMYQDWSL